MSSDRFIKDPEYRKSNIGKFFGQLYNANDRHTANQYDQDADAARLQKDHLKAAYNSTKAAEYYDKSGDRDKAALERREAANDNQEYNEQHDHNNGCCRIS